MIAETMLGALRIGVDVADERPVDLQHVDGHRTQARERRVARAEVVDRQLQTAT